MTDLRGATSTVGPARSRAAVAVREVGPREGLQVVPDPVDPAVKVELITRAIESGFGEVNAVSLVNPKVLPQMADAEEVLERLGPQDVCISALAPSRRGIERAARLKERGLVAKILLIHAMSAEIIRANGVGRSLEENRDAVLELARTAKGYGLETAVFVSAAFGCSVEGRIEPDDVIAMSMSLGPPLIDEVILGDSTGQASPWQVRDLLDGLAAAGWGSRPLGLHLHDSRGAGLANAVAAIESSIEHLILDASFGGWGGDVPFIPEAAGNIATEDLVVMLDGMGVETGIDSERALETARIASELVGVPLNSRSPGVGPVRWRSRPTRSSDEAR